MATGHVTGSIGSIVVLTLFLYGFLYYNRTGGHPDPDRVREQLQDRDTRTTLALLVAALLVGAVLGAARV